MRSIIIFLFCTFVACQEPPTKAEKPLAAELAKLGQTYVNDRRTDRLEVESAYAADTLLLTGYTTLPAALRSLDSLLALQSAPVRNDVRLLPDPARGGYGLVRVSVANIRTHPGHSQELTSQALMGTPLRLLDYVDGWYMVRTPDRYIAWLEEGALTKVELTDVQHWFTDGLRTCVRAQSEVRAEPNENGKLVSELVAGDLLHETGPPREDYTPVRLPDGRKGYVPSNHLAPYRALARPDSLDRTELLATADALTGRPYLWGGTSPKAMDCSGLTKTAYYLNGYVIPRDASQQVHAGEEVALDNDFSALRRGDLLFFGSFRDDGSERITHVGFYLGDGRMLHAGADNGYITENSLREGQADFAAHRRASLLRARRLSEDSPGVVPIYRAFADLLD